MQVGKTGKAKNYFEGHSSKHFESDANYTISQIQNFNSKHNMKKTTPRHIVIAFLKTHDKEKILKADREKRNATSLEQI